MASFPPPPPSGEFSSGGFTNAPRTDARAVAALVCGIGGLLVFPLILGAVALILGRRSRREIQATPWALKGLGLATSGMILGGISVVLFLFLVFAAN
jgi:hypothetical protein